VLLRRLPGGLGNLACEAKAPRVRQAREGGRSKRPGSVGADRCRAPPPAAALHPPAVPRDRRADNLLSCDTVKSEAVSICRRLGASSRSQAAGGRGAPASSTGGDRPRPFHPGGTMPFRAARGGIARGRWAKGTGVKVPAIPASEAAMASATTRPAVGTRGHSAQGRGLGPVRFASVLLVVTGVLARAVCLPAGAPMVGLIRVSPPRPARPQPSGPSGTAGLTEVRACGGRAGRQGQGGSAWR
jgi:hypothetical protein